MKHLKQLDGIRAVAALLAMYFHFVPNMPGTSVFSFWGFLSRFSPVGQTGVDLFFVLSGFLITRILLSTRQEQGYFSKFYARRALRIVPLYYFFLILTFFVMPWFWGEPFAPWSKHWYFWVYLQNLPMTFSWDMVGPPHYWSLAVEEHFYIVWPVLVIFLSVRSLKVTAFGLVALAFVLRPCLAHYNYGSFYFTLTRVDALSAGTLLALYEPALLAGAAQWRRRFRLVLFLVLPLLFATFLVFSRMGNSGVQLMKYTGVIVVYVSWLGYALTSAPDSLQNRILTSRFLVFTGKISYGLYVYHPLCYILCEKILGGHSSPWIAPAACALAFGIAYLSFRFLESPFLNLKRYFEYQDKESPRSSPVAC